MSLKRIFVLVTLFGAGLAHNAEIDDVIVQPRILVHELNMSTIFDKTLPALRHYITYNGFDPMDAPDMEIPLSPWPDFFNTKIYLHHGHVQELSTIYRNGDVILQWTNENASLYLNVGFQTVDISHEYVYRYLLYQRKGDSYGRFHNVTAKMMLDFDLKTHKFDTRFFKFTGCGDFELRLEGHLADPILNVITKVLTRVFKTEVLKIIEIKAYEEIQKKVNELNSIIPHDLEETIKEVIAGHGFGRIFGGENDGSS